MEVNAQFLASIYLIVIILAITILSYKSMFILFKQDIVFAVKVEQVLRLVAVWYFILLLIVAVVHFISEYSSYNIEELVPQIVNKFLFSLRNPS